MDSLKTREIDRKEILTSSFPCSKLAMSPFQSSSLKQALNPLQFRCSQIRLYREEFSHPYLYEHYWDHFLSIRSHLMVSLCKKYVWLLAGQLLHSYHITFLSNRTTTDTATTAVA
jgi:hypothetical protein